MPAPIATLLDRLQQLVVLDDGLDILHTLDSD
jgi:hypothetical protein